MTARWFDGGEDSDGYELLVPFVACESNGGEFDDDSFVNGFQVGRLWEMLRDRQPTCMWFEPTLVDQLGLIAGHYRMVCTPVEVDNTETDDHGLVLFQFSPAVDPDEALAAIIDTDL